MNTTITDNIKTKWLNWFGHVVLRPADSYLTRAHHIDFLNPRQRGHRQRDGAPKSEMTPAYCRP